MQAWHAKQTHAKRMCATHTCNMLACMPRGATKCVTRRRLAPISAYMCINLSRCRRGTPIGTSDKSLVQQARHLWFFTSYYDRFPGQRNDSRLIAAIDQTLNFILYNMRDESDGRFWHRVARDGSRGPNIQVAQGKGKGLGVSWGFSQDWDRALWQGSFQQAAAGGLV